MRHIFFAELDSDRVLLTGDEGHHAADVLRIRVGEEIDISNNRGSTARVVVTKVAKGELEGTIQERGTAVEASPRVVVAQALIKANSMSEAIDLMTQTGVCEVVPWRAERSVINGEVGGVKIERWRAAARAAAKQSRRPMIPEVHEVATTTDLIARFREFSVVCVLHEEAISGLAEIDWTRHSSVLLIVGPEGGVSAAELDRLTQAGATPIRIGATVLRSMAAGAIGVASVLAQTAWQ